MLLILMVFFLFVLMSATDIGALVVPTRTGPKSAPRMILELLLCNCLEVLWTCKSPSDCANAGRASAVSMNNSAKVKVASDRVIDLIPMIKNPPCGRSYIVAYFANGALNGARPSRYRPKC